MAKVIMINTKTRTIRVENADKNIDWITVKGTHVPIEKGQSKSSAVKSFVEKKRPDAKKDETTRKFAHEIKEGDIVSAGGKDYKIIQADRNWVIGLDDKGNRLKINPELSFDSFKVKQPSDKEQKPTERDDDWYSDESYVKRTGVTQKYIELSDERDGLKHEILMARRRGRKDEEAQLREEQKKVESAMAEEVKRIDEIKKNQREKQQPAKKEPERDWYRGKDEDEDAYFDRREKTLAEARKLDKVSDWYGKAYKGDSFGTPKNKDLTFDELADGLLSGKISDFYEAVGTGESDVREKIFQELSERTGRPYDDFYDAWLHGGSKGTESRKKKQAESVAWMDKLLELHTDMDPELRKAIVAARDRAKKDS